jgi:hypothetical protein
MITLSVITLSDFHSTKNNNKNNKKQQKQLPGSHSLFDVPEEAAVKLVDGVEMEEEETQQIFRQILLFAHLVTEPLK